MLPVALGSIALMIMSADLVKVECSSPKIHPEYCCTCLRLTRWVCKRRFTLSFNSESQTSTPETTHISTLAVPVTNVGMLTREPYPYVMVRSLIKSVNFSALAVTMAILFQSVAASVDLYH